jgi:hypothetical protein
MYFEEPIKALQSPERRFECRLIASVSIRGCEGAMVGDDLNLCESTAKHCLNNRWVKLKRTDRNGNVQSWPFDPPIPEIDERFLSPATFAKALAKSFEKAVKPDTRKRKGKLTRLVVVEGQPNLTVGQVIEVTPSTARRLISDNAFELLPGEPDVFEYGPMAVIR